jgi:hypothetical protein
VLFIKDTFESELIPTALPDADHGFHSMLLRSLETRTDMTWLIADETKIFGTIEHIHGRQEPTVDEGHEFKERIGKLKQFWYELRQPLPPNKWEPAYYSQPLPPIIKSDKLSLPHTPEQTTQAEARLSLHLRKHARDVSRLKNNPPKPMGFAPQERSAVSSDEAWDLLYRPCELPMDPRGRAIFNDDVYRFVPIYNDVGLETSLFIFDMSREELEAFGSDKAEGERWEDMKKEMVLERAKFREELTRESEGKEEAQEKETQEKMVS